MERVPGKTTLVAFDAANISTTLCRVQGSTPVVNEGGGAALVAGPPTVANGRVYVSGDGGVDVFG
jgi:outer membrane protein assembly factor BamB